MGGSKHVTSACLHCRRRKIKCDGREPCSNCTASGASCEFNAEADLRRASARKVTTNLRTRLSQLEDVLREHNIELPPPTPEASLDQRTSPPPPQPPTSEQERESDLSEPVDAANADINDQQGLVEEHRVGALPANNEPASLPTSPAPLPVVQDMFREGDHTGLDYMDFGNPQLGSSSVQTFQATPSPTYPQSGGSRQTDSGDDAGEDEITNILAARMGTLRIAEDGQLRYYGPTSNLHVHHNGFQSLSRSTIRHVVTEGNGVLQRLGLGQQVSSALEMHLARLYFAWEDPAIHVVDEETFFTEKQKWLSGDTTGSYYSETLNNAICAIGACLAASENLEVPEPAAEFFSSRAKALLDIEMDSPTVATVQALVIMSASEAAFTRDARGWLYSGMAARLSVDLGLHMDITKHQEAGHLSQHDMDIRRTAFWGVFVHESMWSLYVGRPWGLSLRDITALRPPDHLDEAKGRTWKPYPATASPTEIPPEGLFFPLEACTAANITLCEFMRRINKTLYSGRTVAVDALVSFLASTTKKLYAWRQNMAESLRIDLSKPERLYVPTVLQLHMQYNAALISLYRPYLSSRFARSGEPLSSLNDQLTLHEAAAGCIAAAHEIAELLRCYQRQHSIRRTNVQIVHIVFTASLVFIYDVCTRSYADARASLTDLQFCCHALGEIGQSYGNATRALEVIILVKSEWQKLAAVRPSGSVNRKRPSMSMSAGSQYGLLAGDHDNNRSKRRNYPAGSGMDPFDLSASLMAPSMNNFMAFGTPQVAMPNESENMFDAWHLLNRADFGMGDMDASNPLEGGLLNETSGIGDSNVDNVP